jgi:hypothetical protein
LIEEAHVAELTSLLREGPRRGPAGRLAAGNAGLRPPGAGRRRYLKIAATWPWAPAIVAAWNRISALAQAP